MINVKEEYENVTFLLGNLLAEKIKDTQELQELFNSTREEKILAYYNAINMVLDNQDLAYKIAKVLKRESESKYQKFTNLMVAFNSFASAYNIGTNFVLSKKSEDSFGKSAENLVPKIDKTFTVPFEAMSLTFEDQEAIFIMGNIAKSQHYEVTVFQKENGILSQKLFFLFTLDKLPRIYIGCSKVKDCKHAISVNKAGMNHCMKTHRTCTMCDLTSSSNKKDVKKITFAESAIEVLAVMFEVIRRYNKQPQIVYRNKQRTNENKSNTNGESKKRNNRNDYILINKTNYRYVEDFENEGEPNSTHKGYTVCEHNRKGHYRHYKSGKKVWIEDIKVNSGKGVKKTYKI